MSSFDFLWQLLENHGVVPGKKAECARLWDSYTLQQQRDIYRSIRDKLRAGKFVHYDPVRAVKENAPRQLTTTLSFNDYYARFGTTEEQGCWKRIFIKEQQKTVYIK